jgi:dihydroorotate dehydrogenase (NAD+) catalytic subunit
VKQPSLITKVGRLELQTPVIAASGTFGYGLEFEPYVGLDRIGGLVTKGISLKPREGNPPQRIWETACGMLNAIGLANVGIERFIKEKLPALAKLKCAVIVNLYGEAESEFAELARALDGKDGIDALELNVSCPNVKSGGMAFGVDPEAVASVTKAVKNETGLPVWVKLTPNVTSPVAIAQAAVEAGADAISLINTLLGMAINARTRKPRLANVVGGLSGPAIKPVGLRMVWQVAKALPGVPLVGMGGIAAGEDAAEYLIAGACAVQVGTGNFMDPSACERIANELASFCQDNGVDRISDLIGSLETPA